MAQKKPMTPFEHHSSEEVSSEEEVESSESEEGEDPKKQDPKPDSSSEEDGSDSSGSDDEEEVTPVAPVKPVVVQSPKVRAKRTLAPATAPASAVTAPKLGKKRPGESTENKRPAESKKLKKVEDKRLGKNVVDYPKKRFQRVFSEKDEIMLLEALLEYSANKCIHPIDFTNFHEFVKKKSTHIDVTRAQLAGKIKKMKRKYENNACNTKETFGKAHDQSCYDLSKMIWEKYGGSELKRKRIPKTNMTPGLQIPQVVEEPVGEKNISLSELFKTRDVVGMMCCSDDTFMKNLELLGDAEARAALEEKLKNMVAAELELTYKRLELSRELMKSSLDGHRG